MAARLRWCLLVPIVALVGALSPVAVSHAAGPPRAASAPFEGVLPSWNTSLIGVSGVSADDVWAVGWRFRDNHRKTLIEHWDGSAWTVVPSPNRSPWQDNVLTSVTALSPTDAWAVGFFGARAPGDKYRTWILHWDGFSWRPVHSPDGHNYTILSDVSAVDADDIWAVGAITKNYGKWYRGLFEHWDGTCWSIVDSTTPRRRTAGIQAVSAVSSRDVWATTGGDAFYHYDGTWSQYDGAGANGVYGLSMLSADDGWAVERDHALHWDGSTWNDMYLPDTYLYGVSGDAGDDVWAVGDGDPEHWDGSTWTAFPSGGPGTYWDVDVLSRDDAWAVGFVLNERAVTEHWDGVSWTAVPVG